MAPQLLTPHTQPGDRYLLCSDGPHTALAPARIRDTLTGASDPDETAGTLIELVRRAGAPDNVACVVADVLSAAA